MSIIQEQQTLSYHKPTRRTTMITISLKVGLVLLLCLITIHSVFAAETGNLIIPNWLKCQN